MGRNAKVKYVEKHYGTGEGYGKRILNPVTEVYQEEGSYVEMEWYRLKEWILRFVLQSSAFERCKAGN